jgi:putative hydrolase
MTERVVDCHAHTTMSDGDLSVVELIDRVRERGVTPAVADHLSQDVSRGVGSVDGIERYLDELERHDVLRGGEFCHHDTLWRELPREIRARFTHAVGSLHAVPVDGRRVHAFSRRDAVDLQPGPYMDAVVAAAEDFARVMPVDILAHPTLVNFRFRTHEPEDLWTEAHEERLVEALARAGIAFEISNRYRAHDRLIRRAIDRGVRISLGSDGHTRQQVGDIAWPLETARRLGADIDDLYDPARHGTRFHQ